MDLQLFELISKCDKYRVLANSNNPFTFTQANYEKYIYYRQKLKEYSEKHNTKIEIKYKVEKFVPMSDFSEQLENYSK